MKFRHIFLLFGFCSIFISCTLKQSYVIKTLKTIPKEDRDQLDWLFRYLFLDTFSYVLFGHKPMSISSFQEIDPSSPRNHPLSLVDLPYRFCVPNLRANRGWSTWSKYRHLFPSSNFFLLENRDSDDVTIIMINKYAFLKIVRENLPDFKNSLGDQITPESLFNQCLKSNDVIKDVLKQDDHLLGILLGFGSHNALLFSRRLNSIHEDDLLTFFNESGSVRDFNPLMINLPGFMADCKHIETQQLKFEYTKQYKNILRKYKQGDFLEITLKQFCGY